MKSILCTSGCILVALAYACYAVDGFAVAAADGDFGANLYGGFGHIVRVEINKSKPGAKKELSSTKGRFARISQDGKRVAFIAENKDIIVMSACDGSDSKVIGKAETNKGYLAWVNNKDIYFSGGGYKEAGSKKLFSVPADGSADQKQIATFNHTLWVWGISEDGTRATVRPSDGEQGTCGGNKMGEVYKCTLPGNVKLTCGQNVIDNQACGNAISPSGTYISYFGSTDHSVVAFKKWDLSAAGSVNTKTLYSTTSRNNRTRWSSNSEDWLCLYHSKKTQVLLKRDGSKWIKVNSSGSHMPGDFWVGTPPKCDETGVGRACLPCNAVAEGRITIVREAGGSILVRVPSANASARVEIVDSHGRIVSSARVRGSAASFAGLPGGVYMARISSSGAKASVSRFIVR